MGETSLGIPADPEPVRVGRYEVLGHLATGGMADILLARLAGPAGFQKVVVIKRVLPHLARKAEFRTMFLDEARIVASLDHPNIVRVTELGQTGTELYLVMEYLDGEPLSRLIGHARRSKRPLDCVLAAHVLAHACAGLHAAHEFVLNGVPQRLVHRDVSPQNLFITYEGAVRVIDFGVAKAVDRDSQTTTGQIKGKFGYMSPEQCLALPIDRRGDVFALGVVLWEALASRRLFKRDNQLLVFKAICEDPIPSPSQYREGVPPSIERIVLRALERSPEDRYATADDMRRDLIRACRQLAPDRILEDDLRALMNEVFAERIAQKRELVTRAADIEVAIQDIPWAEDQTPSVSIEGVDAPVKAHSGLHTKSPSAPGRRSPLLGVGAAVAALVLVGALVFAFTFSLDDPEDRPASEPSSEREPEPAPESERGLAEPRPEASPPPVASTEAPAPREVAVELLSDPEGATVSVDGAERGRTPVTVNLPVGTTPVDVELTLDGHQAATETIVPDVDQRIRVSLERAAPSPSGRTRRRPGRSRQADAPSDAPPNREQGDGFFRFD